MYVKQINRNGRKVHSNAKIALVIESWVCGQNSKREVGECFNMSENSVKKIIATYYKPSLSGDLMSITIPSKANNIQD